MHNEKRLRNAFIASVLINALCIAWVGGSSLVHPPALVAPKHDPDAALHPVTVSVADAKPLGSSIGSATGSKSGSGGEGSQSGGAPGQDAASAEGASDRLTAPRGQGSRSQEDSLDDSSGGSDSRGEQSVNRSEASKNMRDEAMSTSRDRGEDRMAKAEGSPYATELYGQTPNQGELQTRAAINAAEAMRSAQLNSQSLPQNPTAQTQPSGQPSANQQAQVTAMQSEQNDRGALGASGAKNHPAGAYPWTSIQSKYIVYPRMKIDAGTIHMRRPTHGITGGGSADMRNVDITAHLVVDDPDNVPKTLAPDRIIHRFAGHCSPDPGNTAKCIPTGGNTLLGGGVLHGHDHITGMKYCVPGAPGIPGTPGQSNQSSQTGDHGQRDGRNQGALNDPSIAAAEAHSGWSPNIGQTISDVYRGSAPARAMVHAHSYLPSLTSGAATNVLHLPASDNPQTGLVPGAAVPIADRKWVYDPHSHVDTADPGMQMAPMPRFTVAPRNIGSMDSRGTVLWGNPRPIKHKKKPYGGDGTGLMGVYYLGNDFNKFMFRRPDRDLDFDWTGIGPSPMMPKAAYSVRWMGTLVPKVTDTYTILTTTDDGIRVYLDGKLIICNWTVHAPYEDTAAVNLVAGQAYNLKIEYYENDGISEEVMKLYWQSPHVPLQYIPEDCLRYPLDGHVGAPDQ